ncbi:MAG: hypothetical protein AB7N71_07990 [Phycisphaerae bacterium]
MTENPMCEGMSRYRQFLAIVAIAAGVSISCTRTPPEPGASRDATANAGNASVRAETAQLDAETGVENLENVDQDDAPQSLLGKPLLPMQDGASRREFEDKLAAAQTAYGANPDDLEAYIWVGRRLGYLWRMQEAIDWYSRGLEKWPDEPRLLRHRGHRYLSLRKFDAALADFERAAALVEGRPDEIEQDGLPNAQNIPLTTLGFNIWYHIGVARFCKADFDGAVAAFEKSKEFINDHDDNRVAVSDWLYMALRRTGRDDEAKALLTDITRDMNIIENDSYHQRLLMYKGEIPPASLLDTDNATDLELATQGFGVGHWHLLEGRKTEASQVFEKVVAGKSWPAFGFIAAEAELARRK